MYNKLFSFAKISAILCVIPFTIYLCLFLNSLRKASDAVAALPKMVDDRTGKIEKDVLDKIDKVQENLNKEITSVVKTTDARLDKLTNTTDKRIDKIQTDVVTNFDSTKKDLFKEVQDTRNQVLLSVDNIRSDSNNQLTTLNTSITKLSDSYSDVPKIIGARMNTYTDCGQNSLCWQGQISDTLLAVRESSKQTSITMESVNKSVPAITQNFAGITENINSLTHPRLVDRIMGYALNGLIMYRSLNPAANIVTTAAQAMVTKK